MEKVKFSLHLIVVALW